MSLIDIVKGYWESERVRDLDKVLSNFTDSAMLISPGHVYRGAEEIRVFYVDILKNSPNSHVEVRDFIETNGKVAVEYECIMQKQNGRMDTIRGFTMFKFMGDKFSEVHCYYDPKDFE
jgi:ketosteroid isomerase-like protein